MQLSSISFIPPANFSVLNLRPSKLFVCFATRAFKFPIQGAGWIPAATHADPVIVFFWALQRPFDFCATLTVGAILLLCSLQLVTNIKLYFSDLEEKSS